MKTKIIVVTGGVYSSLGKGIVASSIGRILKEFGYKISMQKLDPYLNVDSGTLSPYQHGEVFVTKDGAETDLDLGHYERFIDYDLNKFSTVTAGKIYYEVLNDERNGKYQGKTVQMIPHITERIHQKITLLLKEDKPDFLIIEIGGTIGDIESIPFIEAIRTYSSSYNHKNVLFIHCAPLIKVNINQEIKTKPIQHSVKNLNNLGIVPNILVLRTEQLPSDEIKQKLSLTTDIDIENIFSSIDSKSIYEIPKLLYEQGIHQSIFKYFKLTPKGDLTNWNRFLETIHSVKYISVNICLVGKYIELPDAYLSVIESLKLTCYKSGVDLNLELIDSSKLNLINFKDILKKFNGIIVPGGFGSRGIEGKMLAAKYARENQVPYFGICLGMQVACLEFARDVLNWDDANSTEFDNKTKHPIFDIINPKIAKQIGGTLRLGNHEICLINNFLVSEIYKNQIITERHRHRFCFNNKYVQAFNENGFVVSAVDNETKNIVEIMEMINHPFFVGVQYHPEFTTKPLKPNPLFEKFIECTIKKII